MFISSEFPQQFRKVWNWRKNQWIFVEINRNTWCFFPSNAGEFRPTFSRQDWEGSMVWRGGWAPGGRIYGSESSERLWVKGILQLSSEIQYWIEKFSKLFFQNLPQKTVFQKMAAHSLPSLPQPSSVAPCPADGDEKPMCCCTKNPGKVVCPEACRTNSPLSPLERAWEPGLTETQTGLKCERLLRTIINP